ncbi:Retrotransposon gag domain [Sesbania bispinosa]|nr:Retrotransposon gag domain [Sesbania bispinosa]
MAAPAKDPSQDVSNPLFLHHSDGPGLVLTSQPLDHKNYTTWSRAMKTHSNNVVISGLYNSVSKDIITIILFASTAHEIWEDLKTRFSRKNSPRIFQLKCQLMSLHQGIDNISTYYTKLKSIWEELSCYKPKFQCTCGDLQQLQSFTESEYVITFLMGLNDYFSQIRSQILLSDPLHPLEVSSPLFFKKKLNEKLLSLLLPLLLIQITCLLLLIIPNLPQVQDNSNNPASSQPSTLTPDQCQQLISFLTNHLQTDSTIDVVATNVTGQGRRHWQHQD